MSQNLFRAVLTVLSTTLFCTSAAAADEKTTTDVSNGVVAPFENDQTP